MTNQLLDAIDSITIELLETLGYGEKKSLNQNYSLYHYFDDDQVVLIKTKTWDEIACVQWNVQSDEIELTEL